MAGRLDLTVLLLIAWLSGLVIHGEAAAEKRISTVGSNLQLPCSPPDGEEIVHYFTWSKDGKLVREYSNLFDSRFVLQSDFSLLIQRLREEDEGTYSCYIMSKPPVETVYNVIVQVPAVIEQFPSGGSATVKEGGTVDLVCLVRGRPAPEVTWIYQGCSVGREEYVETIMANYTISSVYKIDQARRNNSGLYVCRADNGVDLSTTAHYDLKVNFAPEIAAEKDWVHAGLGTLTELVCHVDASPSAQVTWYRDSADQIVASNRISVTTSDNGVKHSLRFNSVRDVDLGVYTCQAENQLGKAQVSIEISGKAAAAELRVAAARDGNRLETEGRRHRLIWECVSHSGIIEYRLWLRPVNQKKDKWINITIGLPSASTTSFLHSYSYVLATPASDNNDGVVYDITVQARNKFGWSAESNVVHVTVATERTNDADDKYVTTGCVTEETVKFTDDGGLSTAGDGLDSTVSESESPGPRQRTTVSDGDDALIVTNASPEHTLPTTHTSVYDHDMVQQATLSHATSDGGRVRRSSGHLLVAILSLPLLVAFSSNFCR